MSERDRIILEVLFLLAFLAGAIAICLGYLPTPVIKATFGERVFVHVPPPVVVVEPDIVDTGRVLINSGNFNTSINSGNINSNNRQ